MKTMSFFATLPILFAVLTGCDNRPSDVAGTASSIPDSVVVPLDEAYLMVANYAQHAGEVVHDGDTGSNTRAVWIELERMEAYVAQLRSEGADGIRIYLATYSESYPDGTSQTNFPPRELWGHNTVLFVSTKDTVDAEGRHYSLDYFTNTSQYGSSIRGPMVRAVVTNKVFDCPPRCRGAILLEAPKTTTSDVER